MTSSTTANTYRVGDFVYFDDPTAADAPYQIRKIDELLKSEKGVEARCVVYMRRRDIPQHLLKIADQATRRFDNYYEVDKKKPENFTTKGFIVANGGDPVKEEEMEVDGGDDEPPKIEAESVAGEAVNEARSSSEAREDGATGESKEENQKDKAETEATRIIDWGDGGLPLGLENITEDQRLKLRQHEIFMTRQSEILPASLIRGKCRVVLLGDGETADIYLPHDDTFYHSLVYDPTAQTLLADKGAIRVGERYQAEVDDWMEPAEREEKERLEREAKIAAEKIKKEEEARIRQEAEEDTENGSELHIVEEDMETEQPAVKKEATEEPAEPETPNEDRDVLVWTPYHGLLDRDIDQYLIVARSIGLFARAIDGASAPKLPTLQLAAAFASRDITIFHAHGILHAAKYDVGQAVKYLVPIASREAYPCEIDEAIGVQTKTLGGPILCRDQLEEWSTPEMNLFEDALDKVGKDFNEIRSDYLPWKSVRDIVEYYYLMKASNRYADRKNKAKTGTGNEDTKLSQVYIPQFNKAISASIGQFNTSQNFVRSEVGCENCGTMDAINWYQWGGVEKKVLCSGCWTKWKKFAGLDKKHELERFDKTRPPVLDQQTTAAPASNGNDRPPVLQVQQRAPTAAGSINAVNMAQNRAAQQLLMKQPLQKDILQAAKVALANGQINHEQFITLTKNLPALQKAAMQQQQQVQQQQQQQQLLLQQQMQQHQQQQQAAVQPKKKVVPATKPAIVFYTTICRRAVRRLLPKSAFNLRKLSRRPTQVAIDDEAILKSMIVLDKKTLLQSAQAAAGDKKGSIVETDFFKGITHLQHTLTQATTGKRTAPHTTHAGEPSAKMSRLHFQSVPPVLPSGFPIVAPSLEDIGNSLLAVNEAMKAGRPYLHPQPSAALRMNPIAQQYSQQQPSRFPQLLAHQLLSAPSTSSQVLHHSRQVQAKIMANLSAKRVAKCRELLKTPTDSRWFEFKAGLGNSVMIAGPQLKTKRRQLLTTQQVRRVAQQPYKDHPFLETPHSIINPFFLERLSAPPNSSSTH